MSAKTIKNWTIPPVTGITPDEHHASDGWVFPFARLMGDVISHRRIHNRWEEAEEGDCAVLEPVDIISSEIVSVRRILDRSEMHVKHVVEVTTKSGSVYRLEGEPRPSFKRHLAAFGIEHGPDCVMELVEALDAQLQQGEG